MELSELQKKGLDIAIKRYKAGERYTVISGYAGSGKAQPNSTLIPTPSGWKTLGEIRKGDYVFNEEGKPTCVIGVYPQGVLDVYEIAFGDGRKTLCNSEHLWTVEDTANKTRKTCSTQQIINQGVLRKNSNSARFGIDVTLPVQYSTKQFKVDPYVIGAFLGDGYCVSDRLAFSSADIELVQEIQRLIKCPKIKRKSEKEYTWYFYLPEPVKTIDLQGSSHTKEFFSTLDLLGEFQQEIVQYSDSKRIPEQYKYGDIGQRYALLQGLLDTDGSICKGQGYYQIRFTSISYQLIQDVLEVLYSLGYSGSIVEDKRTNKYKNGHCYSITIKMPPKDKTKMFRLSRKKKIAEEAAQKSTRTRYDRATILSINKLDYQEEMTCIMVDNPTHLYLTNDYIVTHNTTLVKFITSELKNLGVQEENTCYTSLTGKACNVLQQKGNKNVSTLHRLLYEHRPKSDGTFFRLPLPDIEPYKLVIVDECSMVSKELIQQLLKHRVHVIFLGDPFQLPPINPEDDNHLLDNPHVFLSEIHRQAQESEIIRVSMDIRAGRPLELLDGKDVKVIDKTDLVEGMYTWADQILCAKNETRIGINNHMRELLGREGDPKDGDKVICLRNYWETFDTEENPLINGTIGILQNNYSRHLSYPRFINGGGSFEVINTDIITETGSRFSDLMMDKRLILEGKKSLDQKTEWRLMKSEQFSWMLPKEFTYGYAITCHKAQGSQWNKILIFEENFPFGKEEHARWLYTAVTRAAERCVIVRK